VSISRLTLLRAEDSSLFRMADRMVDVVVSNARLISYNKCRCSEVLVAMNRRSLFRSLFGCLAALIVPKPQIQVIDMRPGVVFEVPRGWRAIQVPAGTQLSVTPDGHLVRLIPTGDSTKRTSAAT
jgi:hypothetical protein